MLYRDVKSLLRGHDAQLSAVLTDQANLFITDVFVDFMSCVDDVKAPPLKTENKTRMPTAPAYTQKHTDKNRSTINVDRSAPIVVR